MNPELEAILKAYDAVQEKSSGEQADNLSAIFQSRMDDFLEKHPNLAPETLQQMIDFAYRRWVRAQNKKSGLPPKPSPVTLSCPCSHLRICSQPPPSSIAPTPREAGTVPSDGAV